MATKKRIEELQKEYDNIILEEQRLADAVKQATESLHWFEDATNNATQEEIDAARKREEVTKKQQRIFESKKQTRIDQINAVAGSEKIKTTGSGSGGERIAEDIQAERFKEKGFADNLRQKGGGVGGKLGLGLGIASVVGDLFKAGTDIYIAEQQKSLNTWLANQDIYLKTIETTSRIFQRNLKTFSKGMQGALSSSFDSITQGVQEGAYSAATSSVDFATETLKNTFDTALDKFKLSNYATIRKQQTELENLRLSNQQLITGLGAVSGIAGLFGPLGSAIGGLVTGMAQTTTKILEANSEMQLKRLEKIYEIAEKEVELINEAKKSAVDSAQETITKILDLSKSIENLSLKTDEAAKRMANIIGMPGGNVETFEKYIFDTAKKLTFIDSTGKTTYLNKTPEDMLNIQSQYIEQSTRNGEMSRNDFIKTFQLGEVLGDTNLAATLLGDMDYFNKSIATGTDLIFDMFKEANKAGVSNRKFAKDLQQNLKLAQKYTFKDGVEGMMKMSIWAQKTRFNMQNLENIVDSIQDGGLEGVITKSAKLQVLGGNMAMGADPLAMMYEAWADPEALAKRFTDMTKGVGYFNSKTGEVDIVGPDAMRLKEYAAAAGIDYKDARAQIVQRIKGEQIDKQLRAKYTDEQKAMIYNKAKLNKNGEWTVTVNGEEKNINNLQDTDWNDLMPTEESIEDYVSKIYNLLNSQEGVTKNLQATISDETFENLRQNINERMQENLDWVNETLPNIKYMIEESNDFVTEQNKQQHDLMTATTEILEEQFSIIKLTTEKLQQSLTEAGSELRKSLNAVRKGLEYEVAEARYRINPTEENKKALDKVSEESSQAQDILAQSMGIHGKGEVSEYTSVLKAWAGHLTEDEINKVVDKYDELVKKFGEINEQNINNFESVLDKYNGDAELLNQLYGDETKEKLISKANTEQLNKADIRIVSEVMKYLSKNRESVISGSKRTEITERGRTLYDTQGSDGGIPINAYPSVQPFKDGIISNNNKSIISQANNVTKINDGLVQSDPKDVAIFAKEGGVIGNFLNDLYNDVHSANSGTISLDTVNVTISGSLDLSSGGQSVNIINELQTNPMLLRSLSRMLAQQISSAMNGGRGTLPMEIGSV